MQSDESTATEGPYDPGMLQGNDAELSQYLDELESEPLVKEGSQYSFRDAGGLFAHLQSYQPVGNRWVFRGQPLAEWGLKPSIERLSNRLQVQATVLEESARLAFRRRAHHYMANPPHDEDQLESILFT
jgi:FRG domain-containing protein